MALTLSQLGINKSIARGKALSIPRSGKPKLFSINKGAKKSPRKPGSDLDTHFRLTPSDDTMHYLVPDGEGGYKQTTLQDRFRTLYGIEPGSQSSRIVVRIESLDDVVMSSNPEDMESFTMNIMRWCVVEASALRNGKPMPVCQLHTDGQSIAMERIGLQKMWFEDGENLVSSSSSLVENTPQSAGDLYDGSGNIPLGAACYKYNSGYGRPVLCPLLYRGVLDLTFVDLYQDGIPGIGVFTTRSANDVSNITRSITQVASRCRRLGILLSSIDFELYRVIEKISSPSWEGKKSLGERRMSGKKVDNGNVYLSLTVESSLMLTNLEMSRGRQMIAVASRDTVNFLRGANSDLFGDDDAGEGSADGEIEAGEADEFGAVVSYDDDYDLDEYDDYEVDLDVNENERGDWSSYTEDVGKMSRQDDVLSLFMEIGGLGDKNEAYGRMKEFGKVRSWPTTAEKRKAVWEAMNESLV